MAWGWGTGQDEDARAETFAAVVTAVALSAAVLLPERLAGAALVGILWGRGLWDFLHMGAAPLLGTDLPRRYPWVSVVVKAGASALYLLFALPA
jgi:hypothetical protein